MQQRRRTIHTRWWARTALLALGLALPGAAQAGSEEDAYEKDQRAASVGFLLGTASPLLIATGLTILTDADGEVTPLGTGVAAVGAAGSAVGLPLLGRRSMLAAKHLGETGPMGAVSLFFGIGTVLTGGYAVVSGGNTSAEVAYLGCSAGALLTGGLQLRQNEFISDMRRPPPETRLLLAPTPQGVVLAGSF